MMRFPELSKAALESLVEDELDRVLVRASRILTQQVLTSSDFDHEVGEILRKLNELGHELRLFDINFDVDLDKGETSQMWCGDWTGSLGRTTPLIISFHSRKGVEVEWSERRP